MKKVFLKSIAALFVTILFLTSCNAQKYGRIKGSGNIINEIRNVGSFDKVAVSGSFDVFLVEGNEGKLDIKIEDNLLAYLVTEVDNGKLKIKWKKGTSINTRKAVIITVYYKGIEAVSLSGSGDIIGKDLLKSNNFKVTVAGSGDIKLNVKTNEIDAAISGSGDIDLEGSSESFTAAIAGSGDIDAVNLKTDKAALRISGSGGITITVINELNAKISGSGDIKYKGNPKIEDIKVSGSGDVRTY